MYPEQPYVGSPAYSPSLYGTWDPNWRGFIGTTFIVALEEFPNLISDATQNLMLRSLYNATKGDEYRFGSLEPGSDNLFPAYSNPVNNSCPFLEKYPGANYWFPGYYAGLHVWVDRPPAKRLQHDQERRKVCTGNH